MEILILKLLNINKINISFATVPCVNVQIKPTYNPHRENVFNHI